MSIILHKQILGLKIFTPKVRKLQQNQIRNKIA